ncbi:hypothetical protein FNH09_45805 [Streptomyces adustus]|uniref:Uncharacterized protein n=1 Tax=Streptomyces adustus TaxID=1609272 RepID=A0A5N8VSN7_9ACTN|nr:hypothetical protein [Streptomyces adustus]MPY38267.1 hypothetical protein [Streptomyces adustus]
MRDVHDLLQTAHLNASQPLLNHVRLLVDETLELLTAMRDRRAPSDTRTLACIRTALLAATAALQQAGSHHHEATQLLNLTWQSLTTHHHAPAEPPPNQILLVIRTQP